MLDRVARGCTYFSAAAVFAFACAYLGQVLRAIEGVGKGKADKYAEDVFEVQASFAESTDATGRFS